MDRHVAGSWPVAKNVIKEKEWPNDLSLCTCGIKGIVSHIISKDQLVLPH